jgi:UDP-2,4-diacetamido-2,4,6-trideoxy-beta-L-altropyranose hydrolase
MQNVAFRVDSSTQIGSGHLRRCLALASELREQGARIAFVSRAHHGNLNSEVVEAGFTLLELNAVSSFGATASADLDWLGVSAEVDADETAHAVASYGGVSAIVTDHYGIDATWHRRVRGFGIRIVVIDDLANRPYDCDILIDANPSGNRTSMYAQLTGSRTRILSGARYALLRRQFSECRRNLKARDGAVSRVFVSFGGLDVPGHALRACQVLRAAIDVHTGIDVVVGAACPHLSALRAYAEADKRVIVHVAPQDIALAMLQSDLAVVSGGTTALECACMGLPSIVCVVANNQVQLAQGLARVPCALMVESDLRFDAQLFAAARALSTQRHLRELLGRNGARLVDGRGAVRVAREIIQPQLIVRRATVSDMRAVWTWRNDQRVREMSRNSAQISLAEHERWFTQVLSDPARALLIVEGAGKPVAVVRFDTDAQQCEAEVSIYVTPGGHGLGLARRALQAGEAWLQQNISAIRRVRAEVNHGNTSSLEVFRDAGYAQFAHLFRKELSCTDG